MSFTSKNVSEAKNTIYTTAMIMLVLLAASYGGHSINSKAIQPNADTVFYRVDTTIRSMENQFWNQALQFLREKKKKLKKLKCYVVVDETYDSYTGRLLSKARKFIEKLTKKDIFALRFIHKYKAKKGDTGSYKYLVFALVYGNKRRVLRVKALKSKEEYKSFIIKTLVELKKEVYYECALFDRGFYDGLFVKELKSNNIPFILRAKISKAMKKEYGFYREWECYRDYEIGEHKVKGDLILGIDYLQGKRAKWAFITNLEFGDWYETRQVYRKRWNIENIFKATDGIQLRVQTSDPVARLFSVCLSFLFYNAWQTKNKRKDKTLIWFIVKTIEHIFDYIVRTAGFYRDKLKINFPFWDKIISSI
jgi:hypothetical protein